MKRNLTNILTMLNGKLLTHLSIPASEEVQKYMTNKLYMEIDTHILERQQRFIKFMLYNELQNRLGEFYRTQSINDKKKSRTN